MTAPGSVHDRAQVRRLAGLGLPVTDPDEHVVAGVADQPRHQGTAVQVVPTVDLGAEFCLNALGSTGAFDYRPRLVVRVRVGDPKDPRSLRDPAADLV